MTYLCFWIEHRQILSLQINTEEDEPKVTYQETNALLTGASAATRYEGAEIAHYGTSRQGQNIRLRADGYCCREPGTDTGSTPVGAGAGWPQTRVDGVAVPPDQRFQLRLSSRNAITAGAIA